jgi:hypothetical protein
MVDVHCMVHRTNLVVQTLSNFEEVRHAKVLLATLYLYFNFFPKLNLEFQKLIACLNPKVIGYLRMLRPIGNLYLDMQKECLENINPW